MPGIWLFSTDPDAYSFDDLLRKGRDVWNGVKNPLAEMKGSPGLRQKERWASDAPDQGPGRMRFMVS